MYTDVYIVDSIIHLHFQAELGSSHSRNTTETVQRLHTHTRTHTHIHKLRFNISISNKGLKWEVGFDMLANLGEIIGSRQCIVQNYIKVEFSNS